MYESREDAQVDATAPEGVSQCINICGLLTRMYLFVQIERALLREGLEADGALERPLACAAPARGQRNKTKPRWTNNTRTALDLLLCSDLSLALAPHATMREFILLVHQNKTGLLQRKVSQRTHAYTVNVCE